jgi:hypothetical protein
MDANTENALFQSPVRDPKVGINKLHLFLVTDQTEYLRHWDGPRQLGSVST